MQIGDVTTRSLQAALQGLNARREATQRNLANVETPGYQSEVVDFESSLASALQNGDPSSMTVGVTRSTSPTNVNGNNVAVDQELTGLTETDLRQQLAVEALNAKYRLLRTSITGA
jgi:flagellar basal-body rod protein FlgB